MNIVWSKTAELHINSGRLLGSIEIKDLFFKVV